MKTRFGLVSNLVALFFLLQVQQPEARTWHILLDGTGDAPTIQAGIDSSAAGDSVLVGCGTYLESELVMTEPIVLRSETGLPDCAVIDGQSIATVLNCDWANGDAKIEGMTVTGGLGEQTGGIRLSGSTRVTISDCILRENHGGIAPGGGRGGGLGCYEESSALLIRCGLENNSAYGGGGIYCEGQAELNLIACILAGNNSMWGGGVELRDGAVCSITSCTFYDNNSFAWNGGGVTSWSSNPAIITNTIIAFGSEGSAVDGTFEFTACDLYGNAQGDWIGEITDQLGSNGNICADPLFCDPGNGDFTIRNDSPCAPEQNPDYGLIGALPVGCEAQNSVGNHDDIQSASQLQQCYPNPFNPQTTVTFSVSYAQHVAITVYDMNGRRIAVLADNMFRSGIHNAEWNGLGERGKPVATGTYFIRMETESRVETQKTVLIR